MKILSLDIETSPHLVFTFNLKKADIGPEKIVVASRVLCVSAKWVGKPGVMYFEARTEGARKKMIGSIRKLLCEADAVLTFNGDQFDLKRLNTEMAYFGMQPPPGYEKIDLYRKLVRAKFMPASGKLVYVTDFFKLGSKVKHAGISLWIACINGDDAAWKKMRIYNIRDARLNERLYLEKRAWMDVHPNQNLYHTSKFRVCEVCASTQLQSRGMKRKKTHIYRRLICMACGHPQAENVSIGKGPTALKGEKS